MKRGIWYLVALVIMSLVSQKAYSAATDSVIITNGKVTASTMYDSAADLGSNTYVNYFGYSDSSVTSGYGGALYMNVIGKEAGNYVGMRTNVRSLYGGVGYGAYTKVDSSGTALHYGLYSVGLSGLGSSSNTYGVYGYGAGYGSSSSYGLYGFADAIGTGNHYGVVGSSQSSSSAGSAFTYGLYGGAIGRSTGSTFGLYSSAAGYSTGVAYGVYGTVTDTTGTGAHYGLYGNANARHGGGATSYGCYAVGDSFGIYAKTNNTTGNYAGYFVGNVYVGGDLGIGVSSPTALLHLKAGTATASTAPLKFTSGTNLTTAETGAMEYDGTKLYFTNTGTTRRTIVPTAVSALTAGATVTVDFNLGTVFTLTPGQNETINASNGSAGQIATIVITTSGTTSRTLTFGTNFKTTGTLSTGTTSGKVFTISFAYDGTNWCEMSRTTAM